jgi:hypothetical protein
MNDRVPTPEESEEEIDVEEITDVEREFGMAPVFSTKNPTSIIVIKII